MDNLQVKVDNEVVTKTTSGNLDFGTVLVLALQYHAGILKEISGRSVNIWFKFFFTT